ncbi:hypothetical protein BDN72DRAFT_845014 [Pluteus cervinus]|uniref:Uncharacterized protein n=1 Tax=Pluteus cervinus TaxID=181527 RepID=A0ACD3AJ51_9AGAR|nr:hypothetical protein BDN72DRAFT_845014 [Pluteus cervinus]
MLLSIPGEILASILEELKATNIADIRAAALTCRALLQPSQRCLFASLQIQNPAQLSRLLHSFQNSTYLPGYVHSLELMETFKPWHSLLKPCQWLTKPATIDLFLEFFPLLTEVTTFSFQLSGYKSWRELPKTFQVVIILFLHGNPSLDHLRLPVIVDLPLDLFTHCMDLRALRLSQGIDDKPGVLADDIPKTRWSPHIHHLRRLELFYIGKHGVVHSPSPNLIPDGIDISSLESLEVVAIYTLPSLQPVLQAGTLRKLVLKPVGFRYQPNTERVLDLSQLNLLETLHISDSWDGGENVLPWLPPTLGSLPTPHRSLKSINIIIDLTDMPSQTSAQGLSNLRDVLGNLHGTSPGVLKSIHIEVHALRAVVINTVKVEALCEPHLLWPGSGDVLEIIWSKPPLDLQH